MSANTDAYTAPYANDNSHTCTDANNAATTLQLGFNTRTSPNVFKMARAFESAANADELRAIATAAYADTLLSQLWPGQQTGTWTR